MKPSKRPGKPAAASRADRLSMAKAKPVNLLSKQSFAKKTSKTEGRKGKRAHWDLDQYEGRKMSGAEYENFSQDGIRTQPKKGGTF